MIPVFLNMDTSQEKDFQTLDTLKSWMLSNKWSCDGLAYKWIEEIDDFRMNLHFIEDYEQNKEGYWEVEIYPEYCSSPYTFLEAVDEFISEFPKVIRASYPERS